MDQLSFSGIWTRASRSRLFTYLAAAAAISGAAILVPACGGETGTGGSGGAGSCDGVIVDGVCRECDGVIVNGVCEGKCTADKCLESNVCVGNRCLLTCTSHRDCDPAGGQDCVPAKDDETSADVNVCQFTGKPAGMGIPCPNGFECDGWRACPDNGICFSGQCGGDQAACVTDTDACNGVDNCTFGKCPDGTGCRTDCFTACNLWLTCDTKGEADADAYCTKRDCMSDDECIGGYYCGIVRDPHGLCGSNPPKGDDSFCGTTNEPCVTLPEAGTTRFEGSACVLRKSCLKRGPGAPCTTNLDCSQYDGLTCLAFAGESRCAPLCTIDKDCPADSACPGDEQLIGAVPASCNNNVLDAGEECEIVDGQPVFSVPDLTCQGFGFTQGGTVSCASCQVNTKTCLSACEPRFGAWKGPPGTFCAPCLTDEDCGTAGTYWACMDLSNGQHGCFDRSLPDTCTKDSDCPASAGGKHGSCLDEDFGLAQGDPEYHRCYLPVNLNTNKTSCW